MLMWRLQKTYNAYCTQKNVEKDFEISDPKIHSPCNYIQSFYVDVLIEECGTEKHYSFAMFRNGISKKTRSSYIVTMKNETLSSPSDSEMASKENKIAIPRFF